MKLWPFTYLQFLILWVETIEFKKYGNLVNLIPKFDYNYHRDRTRACTLCCFSLFFSSFEHAKNVLIMGPNNTKNCSLKLIFSYFNMYCQNLVFIVKKTTKFAKKLFLCYAAKPRVGPINSQHNNFKWGNIFAGVCTLVLSLW